jgi:hypothetical protein
VSSPDVRFVIVPHRPRARMLAFVLVLTWLGSLWAAFELARWISVPAYAELQSERNRLANRLSEVSVDLDAERQRSAVLGRSDQVSRAANVELQQTVREREEEVAALRSDVAFYERLVGGSAQRKGLSVHALALSEPSPGTLQCLGQRQHVGQRAGLTAGAVTLDIEGVLDGQLTRLDWGALRQGADPEPQKFAFRYFQQMEGSIMLPEKFIPHRVRVEVQVDGNGNRIERIFPWQELLPQQGT